jgi:hypothetical protein
MKQLVYAEPVYREEEIRLRVEDTVRIIREIPFGMVENVCACMH